jgi:1-deoxy-D-xylulose 5-phosphate reductoisomerase
MTNRDSIKRLVENITGSLATVQHIAGRYEQHDSDMITVVDLNRSAITELQVFSENIELADEAALVKPLHDRVHVLVVQLRVLRNTLEQMENAAEKAIEDVRRISASVEESAPDDDAL